MRKMVSVLPMMICQRQRWSLNGFCQLFFFSLALSLYFFLLTNRRWKHVTTILRDRYRYGYGRWCGRLPLPILYTCTFLFEMGDAKLCLKNLSDIAPCLFSFRFIKSPMACKMDSEKIVWIEPTEERAANIKVKPFSNRSCLSAKFFAPAKSACQPLNWSWSMNSVRDLFTVFVPPVSSWQSEYCIRQQIEPCIQQHFY